MPFRPKDYIPKDPGIKPVVSEAELLARLERRRLEDRREDYYKAHRNLDPRKNSNPADYNISRIMEIIGLNEPFQDDDRSYDWRKKQWDESAKSGNPDLRYLIPEITQGVQDTYNGYTYYDPRNDDARAAGAAHSFLDFPLLGFQDEALAGVNTATSEPMYYEDDGSRVPTSDIYDAELERARALRNAENYFTPGWSWRSWGPIVSGLLAAAPAFTGTYAGLKAGTGAARKALGAAKEAKTGLGRAATEVGALAGAGAVDDTIYQYGSNDGDFGERRMGFSPLQLGVATGLPAILGTISHMTDRGKAAFKKLFGKAEAVDPAAVHSALHTNVIPRRKMRKASDPPMIPPGDARKFIPGYAPDMTRQPKNVPGAEPTTLPPKKARPQSSVRDDIEQAMRKQK